jgi:hypothetical protein
MARKESGADLPGLHAAKEMGNRERSFLMSIADPNSHFNPYFRAKAEFHTKDNHIPYPQDLSKKNNRTRSRRTTAATPAGFH